MVPDWPGSPHPVQIGLGMADLPPHLWRKWSPRPGSHWPQVWGAGPMGDDVVCTLRQGCLLTACMVLGTPVHSPYDYFLSTYYKLIFFFYKNLF